MNWLIDDDAVYPACHRLLAEYSRVEQWFWGTGERLITHRTFQSNATLIAALVSLLRIFSANTSKDSKSLQNSAIFYHAVPNWTTNSQRESCEISWHRNKFPNREIFFYILCKNCFSYFHSTKFSKTRVFYYSGILQFRIFWATVSMYFKYHLLKLK